MDRAQVVRVRIALSTEGPEGGHLVAETVSDNYGDFKFDRLDENSGGYQIEIVAPGRGKKSVEARLGASINLGEIRL